MRRFASPTIGATLFLAILLAPSVGGADAEKVTRQFLTAHQANLAFLVRWPFDVASLAVTGPIRSEWYVLDGTRGNFVTARLGPHAGVESNVRGGQGRQRPSESR